MPQTAWPPKSSNTIYWYVSWILSYYFWYIILSYTDRCILHCWTAPPKLSWSLAPPYLSIEGWSWFIFLMFPLKWPSWGKSPLQAPKPALWHPREAPAPGSGCSPSDTMPAWARRVKQPSWWLHRGLGLTPSSPSSTDHSSETRLGNNGEWMLPQCVRNHEACGNNESAAEPDALQLNCTCSAKCFNCSGHISTRMLCPNLSTCVKKHLHHPKVSALSHVTATCTIIKRSFDGNKMWKHRGQNTWDASRYHLNRACLHPETEC